MRAVYKNLRETVDESFGKINEQAVRMAAQTDVEPDRPRAAGRQRHRANAHAENVISKLLTIACTLPVISCECER